MSNRPLFAVLILACVGCGQTSQPETPPAVPEPSTPDAAPPLVEPAQNPPAVERVEAQAGVGQRGRSLDNETGVRGMIAEPAKALFSFQEKAVFDIQIPQALQLFRATEGRAPNSHQEFMDKIIRPNNIRLPELPEGQNYVFDPERGELMVERPQ